MRLIDADKLPIWSFPISWEEGVGIEKCCEAVKDAPTVEAIPIEWIKKWIEDNPANHQVICMLDAYRNPKMDWRKENE